MRKKSLNDTYLKYSNGDIKRETFESLIFNFLWCNQEKTRLCSWKREEYEDYLSWFYPRLQKAIDSYHDIGSSFEAFIYKFLSVSSKEYRTKKTIRSITEYSTWNALVPELYLHEEPPSYSYENPNTKETIKNLITEKNGRKHTRRLLALVLKCYHNVSDDFVDSIAPKIGMDIKELSEMMEKMRKMRRKKDDALYYLKERIYCQYYRCLIYERRISIINEYSPSFDMLKNKIKIARKRLENMRKRLLAIRTDASNREIAEVIGIKKGTVDSCLFKLKDKWKKMAKKSVLN